MNAEICPRPPGYFTNKTTGVKTRSFCNTWGCPVCGERKIRRFLYQLGMATYTMIHEHYKRFRGMTLTLGENADNRNMGKYLHRFFMALKKAGYKFDYLWVKEFTIRGKLHVHALITTFIPWSIIKAYWRMATDNTSFIVWIADAQIRQTTAYMAKYMTKELIEAPFRKGERRYSMSKGMREAWPKIEHDTENRYEFTLKPDNSELIKEAMNHIWQSLKNRMGVKISISDIFGERDVLQRLDRKQKLARYRKTLENSKPKPHNRKSNEHNTMLS